MIRWSGIRWSGRHRSWLKSGWRESHVEDFGPSADSEVKNPSSQTGDARRCLRLMSWNIAYARGPNPDNRRNDVGPAELVRARLSDMARFIRSQQVDVLLLQEVDFDSSRTHGLDQLALLADESGLRYGARALSWSHPYVPYPYWPPAKHYGRVSSGGALLSRFPIREARYVLHPQPRTNPAWYNYFYLFRYSQLVKIRFSRSDANEDSRGAYCAWIINNHLEAFDSINRFASAEELIRIVRTLGEPVLALGGDLNTLPPEASKKNGFRDAVDDDYRYDRTLTRLREALPQMRESIDWKNDTRDEEVLFTFPSLRPTRRIDHFLVDRSLEINQSDVLYPGPFSDHRPITVDCAWPA